MKSVLFVDPVCPKPYTSATLLGSTLGGTEATVLRVAAALGSNYSPNIAQRNREFPNEDEIIRYIPLEYAVLNAQTVITLRDAGVYVSNIQLYGRAKHFLWLHDAISGDYRDHLLHHLAGKEAHLIVVSEWHKQNAIEALRPILGSGKIKITRIYNPLAEYCVKQDSVVDPFKLVFFSSPHKGLDYVVKLFGYLKNIDNRFTLHIANPGYFPDDAHTATGIVNLGSRTHRDIVDEVRTALCTFYPQTVFPETFGLVMAESNAVGTPVLAHPMGAAREVLEHPSQLLDCRDYKPVVDKVIAWSKGDRPILKGNPKFAMKEVIKEWIKLIKQ